VDAAASSGADDITGRLPVAGLAAIGRDARPWAVQLSLGDGSVIAAASGRPARSPLP
jgi:hypothetical protein